ncbi:MAG: allophanate hydrolase [Burkholderiales bacterium]|nr:allophanate hydrolase [Burkholderiales bacterium]
MDAIPSVLTISAVQGSYLSGKYSPVELLAKVFERIKHESPAEIWIGHADRASALARAKELGLTLAAEGAAAFKRFPLLGIPFAVKDNIDVAGLPTSAACPAFAYTPSRSAEAVDRLQKAGAIVVGKTNLDQFATGLVGTRSPYGAVKNPFNADYISGGSSSGSAAAVAHGFVAFSLGTDTAGSGRVPAGFCNLVGIKPTPGLVSTRGVVPACRSLDCISVFAHGVEEGWRVLSAMVGKDQEDPYSYSPRMLPPLVKKVRIGIPAQPEFFGDDEARKLYEHAVGVLEALPQVSIVPFDFSPLHEVAQLLYDGPWVAERRAALGTFFETSCTDMDATVREVIRRADGQTAVDAFNGIYRLEAGKRLAESLFAQFDMLTVPTAPTHFSIAQIAEQPVARNAQLGLYTNFVNLLGMCALALPTGFRSDGLPAGVTLIGPGGADYRLAEFARALEPLLHKRLGRSEQEPPRSGSLTALPEDEATIDVAVVGAHLSGQSLNWQLIERGARLVRSGRTASRYRLYALPGTTPPKPGLIRSDDGAAGCAIEIEVWQMPVRQYGSFVAEIPSPLGIGSLELEDGSSVQGFLCEAWALKDAQDISAYGGWRAFRADAAFSTSLKKELS